MTKTVSDKLELALGLAVLGLCGACADAHGGSICGVCTGTH